MAKVIKNGKMYKVVNSKNGVPVGRPNTFSTRSKADTRAKQIKCKVMNVCPRK